MSLATRISVFIGTLPILFATAAHAQLRPLDPFDWWAVEGPETVIVEAGGGWLSDQRASLAGTEGTLWEAGNWRAFWRSGRVVIEAGGTVQRIFREHGRFADAAEFVTAAEDGKRHGAGDYRIATAVRLTNDGAPVAALLRFGTRLPTTDNRVGLDRDATDFFATIGGRARRGPLAVQGEAGVGIFGTRDPDFEQDDLLVYALKASTARGSSSPRSPSSASRWVRGTARSAATSRWASFARVCASGGDGSSAPRWCAGTRTSARGGACW